MRTIYWSLALVIRLCVATPLVRAEAPEPIVRLSIHPSAATQPSLRYTFLPDLTDQTPGNAATLYLIASKLGPAQNEADELLNDVYDELAVPPAQLNLRKAAENLAPFRYRLQLADEAAHREEARWDTSVRERGVEALLPYLNDMRGLATLWSLDARVRIAQGDWPAAARDIADVLTLGRQLNRQAVLVQGLVGAGIVNTILESGVRDWISHGDSPNLYWPLSALPEPFMDVHEVALWDRAMVYFSFPILRCAQNGSSDPKGWRDLILQLPRINSSKNSFSDPLQAAMLAALTYPQARDYLLSAGRTHEQIEAMTVDEVVGAYFYAQYRELADEAWKAWEMPFWMGQPELQRQSEAINAARRGPVGNPLLDFVPGMLGRVQFARIEREISLLRVVEAVRDYAARHDGAPPASLDQIKDLPIPLDPVRGQPFRYEQHGQNVTIEALPYTNQPFTGERYELIIVK